MQLNEPRTIEEQYTSAGNADDLTVTSERRVGFVKPCANCGSVEKRPSGKCAPCDRKRAREWKSKNKDKISASGTRYRAENRDAVLSAKKEWYQKNKDRIAEKKREERIINGDDIRARQRASYRKNKDKANARTNAYYKANKSQVLEQQAKSYTANREKRMEISKRWAEKNREKCRVIKKAWSKRNVDYIKEKTASRRATLKSAGKLSRGIVNKLFKLQRGRCPCCGENLGTDYHLDHIVPLSRGGSNTDNNVQLLSAKCNLAKGAKNPVEYMQTKGFLL